jgi:hypothetical protein
MKGLDLREKLGFKKKKKKMLFAMIYLGYFFWFTSAWRGRK